MSRSVGRAAATPNEDRISMVYIAYLGMLGLTKGALHDIPPIVFKQGPG